MFLNNFYIPLHIRPHKEIRTDKNLRDNYIISFADDQIAITYHNETEKVKQKTSQVIKDLDKYFSSLCLQLNEDKTIIAIQGKAKNYGRVAVGNEMIRINENNEPYKYLGLLCSSKNDWKHHISYIQKN